MSRAVLVLSIGTLALLPAPGIHAGVTFDGTAGPAASLTGPAYAIKASQGRIAGANLFHSFGAFSLAAGESATFSNDTAAALANIIGRVTGGSPSFIDGTLRSTIGGASLFLLNPAGIMFGSNAALDLGGSFHASTADYLKFSDDARFPSTGPLAGITVAAPAAFGFTSATPGGISVQGARLYAPDGQILSLVAGDITVDAAALPALLRARGGTALLASVASAGEMPLGTPSPDTSSFGAMGNITIRGGSSIDVADVTGATGGGRIFLRGGKIVLEDSTLDAQTRFGHARGIDVIATSLYSQTGGATTTVTTGAGNAGTIVIQAPEALIAGGALIDSSCDPGCTSGQGGVIDIRTTGALTLQAGGAAPTGVVSNTFGAGNAGSLSLSGGQVVAEGNVLVQSVSAGAGHAGNITVTAGRITLRNGAQIDSSAQAGGAAGTVKVSGTDTVLLSGTFEAGATTLPSGIFSNTAATAPAGAIQVDAGSLVIEAGGEISSSSLAGASGHGGTLTLDANRITIAGASAGGKSSAVVTNAFGTGNAGQIRIRAATLQVDDNGFIQSQSQGAGQAGDILLDLGSLSLTGGGQVSADARATGAGGIVDIATQGTLMAGGANSGIFAQTYADAPGGSIHIRAGRIQLADGASISTVSLGSGTNGNLDINAGASLTLKDAVILTETVLSDGGNISIAARDLISLDHSRITTRVGSGFGNGGNIVIDPVLMVLNGASIIADAFGGNGGNIAITAGNFFMSPESIVRASSQLGISGTIQISSPVVDLSANLAVAAPGFLDAGALLASRCAARFAGRASSLVFTDTTRSPLAPDGLIPLARATPTGSSAGSAGTSSAEAMAGSTPLVFHAVQACL